jgi:hypothetical protein
MRPWASRSSYASAFVDDLDVMDDAVGYQSGTTASRVQIGGPIRLSPPPTDSRAIAPGEVAPEARCFCFSRIAIARFADAALGYLSS